MLKANTAIITPIKKKKERLNRRKALKTKKKKRIPMKKKKKKKERLNRRKSIRLKKAKNQVKPQR